MRILATAPLLALVILASSAQRAGAQAVNSTPIADAVVQEARAAASVPERPGLLAPFTHLLRDMRRVPSADNFQLLLGGALAAAMAHQVDGVAAQELTQLDVRAFRPGAVVGATPIALGAAFTTYAIGRAADRPKAMQLGSDLIRAQLLAEVLTISLKQASRRRRPGGSGLSFPSGHTAITFASATVLQQHFGWKVGLPAYGVAAYVATSRVQMKRHYLSDVAFGAALGAVAGRTVTLGGQRFAMTPVPARGGGGISFTWLPER